MNATKRYQLKLTIDAALKPYQASAVRWETGWSELRITKYDHPYNADRSVIFQDFIKDEADWQERQPAITAELAAICASKE